jgi:hypothetical protein
MSKYFLDRPAQQRVRANCLNRDRHVAPPHIIFYFNRQDGGAIDDRTRTTFNMRKTLRLRKTDLASIFVIRSQRSSGVRS